MPYGTPALQVELDFSKTESKTNWIFEKPNPKRTGNKNKINKMEQEIKKEGVCAYKNCDNIIIGGRKNKKFCCRRWQNR